MRFNLNTFVTMTLTALLATASNLSLAAGKKVEITPLKWLDQNHLEHQVERIDEISREHLGAPIRGDKSDIDTLQRIIYKGLIPADDTLRLQAMGAVLGNLMAKEWGLVWQVYEDKVGRSRAVCVEGTEHCLFPVTMLSRRMEVGIIPNVQEIVDYCHSEIRPYLKKLPYEV